MAILTGDHGRQWTVGEGTRLETRLGEKELTAASPVMAALLDGVPVSLSHPVEGDHALSWVTYQDALGKEIYVRTLTFVLYMAVSDLFYNTRLAVGHSLGGGIYFDFATDIPINNEVLGDLRNQMNAIIARDIPIRTREMGRLQAQRFFAKRGMHDKVRLLENTRFRKVPVVTAGGFADLGLAPIAERTGAVSHFDLKTYNPGFILQYPSQKHFRMGREVGKNTKLFHVYQESKRWGKILGVNNLGRLNQIIRKQGASDLIKIAESLHEKKIASIADQIAAKAGETRLVLVAGPSASGKTTFSKRLAIHLRVNGLRPVTLSVDDYFLDRDKCPRDEKGDYDFEHIQAVDLPLLNRHLVDLLNGVEVPLPRFSFETGTRMPQTHPLRLADDQILIVEGIHCLNDKLTELVPSHQKFRIYISALTQLSVDDHNRIHTTDTRMIRRMVRDARYRNYSASQTLNRFPSVTRGEKRWIFPFQEKADVLINSALIYELAVLKKEAIPLLERINPGDPAWSEAIRLLTFLNLFSDVPSQEIPPTSILREFIGGSSFV